MGDNAMVGGLIGRNNGAQIINAYSEGPVSAGAGSSIGGLVGLQSQQGTDCHPTIHTSFSLSHVSRAGRSVVGGLIGSDIVNSDLADGYWDLDTSGVSNPHQGAGNVSDDPGITGLTDAQLKSSLPAGFDKKIWKQNPKNNSGYPYLASNPPQ
jgi:hypothetical protein